MPQPVDQRTLVCVIAGGALGVSARALITTSVEAQALPWAVAAVNVLGSLLLGVLVGVLGKGRPLARAFLGTGALGGFTTYSAFAVHTALWAGAPLLAAALAAASLLAGIAGAVAGLAVGRRIAHRAVIEAPEDAE